jgi:hypothetical protein
MLGSLEENKSDLEHIITGWNLDKAAWYSPIPVDYKIIAKVDGVLYLERLHSLRMNYSSVMSSTTNARDVLLSYKLPLFKVIPKCMYKTCSNPCISKPRNYSINI